MRQRRVQCLDGEAYRFLSWAGVVLQVIALAVVLIAQRWAGGLSLSIFLALSVFFLLLQNRLPNLIDLLVVVAALINAAIWAWSLQTIVFYDELTHAYSSFAVVSALGWIAWTRGWIGPPPGSRSFLLVVAVSGLILGIAWEIVEFAFMNIPTWDTVTDLVMDMVGGFCAGLFLAWAIRRKSVERRV